MQMRTLNLYERRVEIDRCTIGGNAESWISGRINVEVARRKRILVVGLVVVVIAQSIL